MDNPITGGPVSLPSASSTSRWFLTGSLIVLASCLSGDRPGPVEPRSTDTGPRFAISDAVHSGGTAGFYFLPPMVSNPTVTGEFDADIATVNPQVVICDVTTGTVMDCTALAPVVIADEKYKINWDTRQPQFVAGRIYRVYVQAGLGPNQRSLGFADILLTEPGKAKHLGNGDVIVLKDGRTLPIHFRIEQGVVLAPGDAQTFVVSAPTALVAGTSASVTVTARDANGLVATGYRGSVAFTSSDAQASLPSEYMFTEGDGGIHTFTDAVTLKTAGAMTVSVADAVNGISREVTIHVSAAAAEKLRLAGIPDDVVAGVAHDLTVTALDAFDNTASGYRGTVRFATNDPAAQVPGDYAFTESDAGAHTFAGVTFKTAGERTLQVEDAATSTIAANLAVTVSAAAAATLRFTTQPSGALAGENIMPPVTVTAYDAFANIAAAFTGPVTMTLGANPGSGTLSGTLTRAAVAGVATFADLRISAGGPGYTLVASATDLAGVTSEPFTITAPAPVEVRWKNPTSGLWSVASNWSTGAVPAADQSVFIDLPGTYTVTLDVNATVNSVTLGSSSGVQSLTTTGSRTLTLLTSGNVLGSGRVTLNNSTIGGTGTLSIAAGAVLNLVSVSAVNTPLVNAGSIITFNSSVLNGSVTTVAGSLMRILSVGFGGARLTVASGFTNHGIIELTGTASNGVSFVVNGTLLNAADGTISILRGVGGDRTITAEINNEGRIELGASLALDRQFVGYTNSGVIAVNGGNLTVVLNGAKSFTNNGTLTLSPGRTLSIGGFAPSGGSFRHAPGATLDGGGALSLSGIGSAVFDAAFSLAALSLESSAATFATAISTETLGLSVSSSTISGAGLTNAAGKTMTIVGSTIASPFTNAGTLIGIGSSTLSGAVTTAAGSTMRVLSVGFGGSQLTVSSGFTNNGVIELTGTATNGVTLNVNGTLVNASGATITSLVGVGGARTLNAQLDNRGTLSVLAALLMTRGSADYLNSGTIAVSGGTLTVQQSGTTPSFTNTGTLSVSAGRTLFISSGAVTNDAGGSIQGDGTFQTGNAMTLNNAGDVTVGLARIGSVTSTGSFAPVTAEFLSTAAIPVGVGYSYTNVRVLASTTFAGSVSLAGDLTVAGSGNLVIGAHEISVSGNFTTQNPGVLTMQNASGALNVAGGASFGGGSTNGRLTAGTLRVGGNFAQAGGAAAAFAATANHVTVLNGSAAQSVTFATPGTTTVLSHFQRLEIQNASAAGVTLATNVFANGQLRTPAGATLARTFTSVGQTLQVGGLDAAGLVLDGTLLRVVNGDALVKFDDAVFRNMDVTATQLRLDRRDDVVTFNNIQFPNLPTTGVYLHLVDTDPATPLFTVTMQGTQPANHGGRVIESMVGQLTGWPF